MKRFLSVLTVLFFTFGILLTGVPGVEAATGNGPLLLSFPVISDIHLARDYNSDNTRRFANALQDLNSINPNYNALAIVGDLTTTGLDQEYDNMLRVLRENPHGPVYYTMGNHDYWKARVDSTNNINDATFPNGETEQMSQQRFMQKTGMPGVYYDKWITANDNSQYHFIFLGSEKFMQSDKEIGDKAYISDTQIAWLEQKLAESANESKPIFVFVHQPMPNTVPESYPSTSIIQYYKVRKALGKYPQVILFTGHTHYDLNLPNNMVQQYYTMFNTSSVYYVLQDNEQYLYPERTQGLYVEVYNGKVIVKSREFSSKQWIARGTWELTYPLNLPRIDVVDPTWPQGSTVSVSDLGARSLRLNWTAGNDNTGVTAYNVYQDGSLYSSVAGNVTSCYIKGLEPNTNYKFTVKAQDKDENMSTGLSVNVKTSATPGTLEPHISLSSSKVLVNQNINVTVSNLQGTVGNTDWIGLYEENVTPGGSAKLIWWQYLPALGITSSGGTFTFNPANIPNENKSSYVLGKNYKFILARNDSYVTESSAGYSVIPIVKLSSYAPSSANETISVTVDSTHNPAHSTDWIGLYEENVTPGGSTSSIWWEYLPALGITSGSGTFTFNPANIKPDFKSRYSSGKTYKFVLGYDDSYTVQTSTGFSLMPSIVLSSNVPSSTGETISVTVRNARNPMQATDWIGVYEENIEPGSGTGAIWWEYLPALGITNGSGTFTFNPANIPADNKLRYKPGKTYKFVMAYNDSYTVQASISFKVGAL